jgi:undecaprenyl phosphate N,N'-diacetylbacillosamine 1-phosphate transferase
VIYQDKIKRGIDLVLSFLMLIILSPVFLVLLISLSIFHKGSPFFFQRRPGINHQPFFVLKFKTMSELRNLNGDLLSDADRLSSFGKLIRNSSLDEIPQLINVLNGDMSLVGPRPLLEEYLELYTEDQLKRHLVKPGITGWAQINGRNAISWEKKFELDLWYVQHLTFFLDIKILFITLYNVIRGKGVSQKGHVTIGRFKGESVV